ncbi:MAG: hypothetical protein JW709_05285 [Sedimentisphaerales bacterium]|nr:hypothetical protein [Sedimentisphaerales bacterium]
MKKVLMVLAMCYAVTTAQAVVLGPYPADQNTLHLYHFDGYLTDVVRTDPIDLALAYGATITDASATGFATALNTYDGLEPIEGPAAYKNDVSVSQFVGADGAFTFEAIIKPTMELASLPHDQSIIIGDAGTGHRGWHFDIALKDSVWKFGFTKITGTIETYYAAIPTTGDHAYAVDTWFHVAVTYNGTAVAPDNLKLYWTKLDSGVTTAQELGSFQMLSDLDPAVTTNICIGNEGRANNGLFYNNFEGLLDAVRFSDIARAPGDMMFGSTIPWANTPVPAHGAVDLDPLPTQLAWNIGQTANITKHYLYLVAEDEPNFLGASMTEVTDLTDPIEALVPFALQYGTVYYWRVDESINDSGPTDAATITGTVWTFTTLFTAPEITGDPVDMAAFPTETAPFVVSFTSVSTPATTWYIVDNPTPLASQTGAGSTTLGDYTVTVTDLGGGSYTSELQIANVETADQDYYYCSVANLTDTVESQSAGLTVNRLLAYYPFDGTAEDTAGDVDGTLKNIDPNNPLPGFVAGVPNLGQAIELDGIGQYVELSTSAYPQTGLGGGLDAGTVSAWVRIDTLAATVMVMGTHSDDTGPACQMWLSGDQIRFRLRQSTGTVMDLTGAMATSLAGDGKWHLIAATYEEGDGCQLYLDGLPLGSAGGYAANPVFDAWQYPMEIGANNDRGTVKDFLDGAIDDMQVYNYPLGLMDIIDMYLVGYPDAQFCVLEYASEFDFSGPEGTPDCVVNVYDFAEMAANWLSCGIYPTCP